MTTDPHAACYKAGHCVVTPDTLNYVPNNYDMSVADMLYRTDAPFYALIIAAMLRADSTNTALLRAAYPEVYAYVRAHA